MKLEYNRKITGAIIGTLFGVAVAWFLLQYFGGGDGSGTSISDIASITAAADPGLLAQALGLFLLSQLLRAFRWMLLSFSGRCPFRLSMAVTSIHVGLGHILPFRFADVAFVGLFRHFGRVPVGHGTARVVLAKLLDLMAMGAVIGSAVAAGVGEMALVAPLLIVGGGAGMIFLSPLLKAVRKPATWLLSRITSEGKVHWFDDLLASSSLKGRKGRMAAAFLLSVLVWISKLYMFVLLLKALGITGIPEWKIFLASGVTNIVMSLPIHGLLGIGTVEAGWTAAFALVGVEGLIGPGVSIVELGFSVHILWMTMASVLMLLAMPLLLLGPASGNTGGKN